MALHKLGFTSGEEGRGDGQHSGRDLRGINYYRQKKLQGYITQHGEYSQYFIITTNGVLGFPDGTVIRLPMQEIQETWV